MKKKSRSRRAKKAPPKPRALLSVSDKTGVVEFGQVLVEAGFEVVSSGGTHKALQAGGVKCRTVESITGFPEILDGRVKTLHPIVHGGILAKRTADHLAELAEHTISEVDVVCVNLYPFIETLAKPGVTHAEIIENIDIGGVALLRAAAKNYDQGVVVVCDPADYDQIAMALMANGQVSAEIRQTLAQKAFEMTAVYDAAICQYLSGLIGVDMTFLALKGVHTMRKGESNAQSPSVLHQNLLGAPISVAWQNWEYVAGNPGHVNLCGGDNALRVMCRLVEAFRQNFGRIPYIAIACKHGNPCGLGVDWKSRNIAIEKAVAGDMAAVMGSEVMVNFHVDGEAAIRIHTFLTRVRKQAGRPLVGPDVVFAPSYSEGASSLLDARTVPRQLMANKALLDPPWPLEKYAIRPVIGGALIQPAPNYILTSDNVDEWLGKKLNREQFATLMIAWIAAWEGVSNSVTLAKNLMLIGTGLGQQDRRGATKLAITRAKDAGHDPTGSFFGSDGFFPFATSADGVLPEATEMLRDVGCIGGVVPADGNRWKEVRQFLLGSGMSVAAINKDHRGFIKH